MGFNHIIIRNFEQITLIIKNDLDFTLKVESRPFQSCYGDMQEQVTRSASRTTVLLVTHLTYVFQFYTSEFYTSMLKPVSSTL